MCDIDEQVQKLIEVLSLTLRCGQFSKDPKNFAASVQHALYIALKNITSAVENDLSDNLVNETASTHKSRGNFISPFSPFLRRPIGNGSSEIYLNPYNLSNVSGSGSVGAGVNPGNPAFRLHRLEIIKVVVLIVVISIILLTTCRMVFQLFLRFRPEKSP